MSGVQISGGVNIRIRGLKKSFGSRRVLDGVNMDVDAGESVVVIGGSGTGKSVLLKCIVGILEADAGSIEVDGEEVVGMDAASRARVGEKFGMLFQGGALFDSLSVWENVSFGVLARKQASRAGARTIATQKLAQVGMDARVGEMFPAELSGGMQKRAALARAIASDPEIIFFDEPTTGLDPIMADVINDLIVKTTREAGATGLTITHDMASARKIGHRIAMLYKGKIIWDGEAGMVGESGNPVVHQFVHGQAEGPVKTNGKTAGEQAVETPVHP